MATKALTAAEFDEVTSGDGIVLIDFWAEWCGPCHRFAPVYERVSEKHPDIMFAKVDTEAEQELSMRFRITSIPTHHGRSRRRDRLPAGGCPARSGCSSRSSRRCASSTWTTSRRAPPDLIPRSTGQHARTRVRIEHALEQPQCPDRCSANDVQPGRCRWCCPTRSCAPSTPPASRGITFYEIRAKSIISRVPAASQVPFQWTINPYRGCSHACRYCFARNTHTYLDLDAGHDFDSKVVVKVNAAELLRRELAARVVDAARTSRWAPMSTATSGPRGGTG